MSKFIAPHHWEQEKVNAYFHSQSAYWEDIYASSGVYAEIHRNRRRVVLDWIDNLALAPGSQVLEVGCGAGFMAVELAQRGFHVHAIDPVEAMIELARRHAAESGTSALLSLDIGDACSLSFENASFDLILAIGVIPWLEQPELAIQEMARVTKPGGHSILTADNRARLNHLLDPWLNPALFPLKLRVKALLERIGLRQPAPATFSSTFHDCHYIDEVLSRAGLVKIRDMTLGFGPFTLHNSRIIPEPFSTALHHRLQRLADLNMPGFRSTGAQYIVLAKKSSSQPLVQLASSEGHVSNATTV